MQNSTSIHLHILISSIQFKHITYICNRGEHTAFDQSIAKFPFWPTNQMHCIGSAQDNYKLGYIRPLFAQLAAELL